MKFGIKKVLDAVSDGTAVLTGRFTSADLSIFHEFEPPPTGGGHQFLRAFVRQAQARNVRVENNSISRTTKACLFNSFNFRETRLQRLKRDSVMYVHRVDGPVDVYRGSDGGVDRHVYEVNQKFAEKSIFQSGYSLQKTP